MVKILSINVQHKNGVNYCWFEVGMIVRCMRGLPHVHCMLSKLTFEINLSFVF